MPYALPLRVANALACKQSIGFLSTMSELKDGAYRARELGFSLELGPFWTGSLPTVGRFEDFLDELEYEQIVVSAITSPWSVYDWRYRFVERRVMVLIERFEDAVAIDVPGGLRTISLTTGRAPHWLRYLALPEVKRRGVVLDTSDLHAFDDIEQWEILEGMREHSVPIRLLKLRFCETGEMSKYCDQVPWSQTHRLLSELKAYRLLSSATPVIIASPPAPVSHLAETLVALRVATQRILAGNT